MRLVGPLPEYIRPHKGGLLRITLEYIYKDPLPNTGYVFTKVPLGLNNGLSIISISDRRTEIVADEENY